MNLLRTTVLALGIGLLLAMTVACAALAGVQADASIGAQLKELGYEFTIDEDGDYKLVMELAGDRTQLVYVRSPVHQYESHAVREIWSPGYRVESGRFPSPVSQRLLEDSDDKVLGGWVKQGEHALFVVKLASTASTPQLEDAIAAAANSADEMEVELSPGSDEF